MSSGKPVEGWISKPTSEGFYALIEPNGSDEVRTIVTVTTHSDGKLVYGRMRYVDMAAPGSLWHLLSPRPID